MSTSAQRLTWLSLLLVGAACPKPQATLNFLSISPDNAHLALGSTQAFVVNGLYSDGSTKVLTDQVEWLVDDALVASVSLANPGVVTALGTGTTNVRARLSGVAAVRSFTVTPSTIKVLQVYPPRPVAPIGLTVHLQLIAVHTDNTIENVTDLAFWTSSDPSKFTVDAGKVVGLVEGTASLKVSYQGGLAEVPVTVTSASVQRLDVEPSRLTLPIGVNQALAAVATLSDQSSIDLTQSVDWASASPAIAFATNSGTGKGVVVARAKGSAVISATVASISGTATVTVSDAALSKIELTPGKPSFAAGTSLDLTATAFFTDGSTRDVTAQSTFTLDSATHAQLDTDHPFRVHGTSPGQAVVTAVFGLQQATASLTITAATLSRLELDPLTPALARGTSQTLHATGVFSDGSTQDLSTQATWLTGDASLAAVSNLTGTQGEVTALNLGSTTISAQLGTVVGQTTLTITAAVLSGLQVTPVAPTLPIGASLKLGATGLFSDGTTQDVTAQASWASATPGVATVSNLEATRGFTQAVKKGSAVISASLGAFRASSTLTVSDAVLVSLSIAPSSLTLARGTSATLTVVGIFSDNSTQPLSSQVTWSSGDAAVGSLSNASGHQGEVQALAVGTTTLKAQQGAIFATVPLTVTQAQLVSIEVAPAQATIVAGLSQRFTATGTWTDHTTQDLSTQVTWTSSAPAVASISNAGSTKGTAAGLSAGTSTITASSGSISGTAALTVSPAQLLALAISPPSLSVTRGTVTALHVQGTYTDGTSIDLTTAVTWSSSDASIVSVSNASGSEGSSTAASPGLALITARLGTVSTALSVTVTPAVLLGIDLTPLTPHLALGADVAFTLTGRYSDGTTQNLTAVASWTSGTPSVASISNGAGTAGKAHALAQGTTAIGAAYGAFSASTVLTVTAATLANIAVTPATLKLAPGTTALLGATGTWTDGSTRDVTTQVTWASSDEVVAQVSNVAPAQGRVLALTNGTASLSATLSGVTGSASLTVSSASLLSIALTPSSPSAPAGLTEQLSATGLFSDGSTQDLTALAGWASSDSSRAAVSNAFGTHGLVTALLVGTSNLTATALGVTSPAVVFTVTSAQLLTIDLTPATASVPLGLTQAFKASGSFTDGTISDLTELATWSTGSPAIAGVSNAAGTRGLVSAAALGNTTVTASLSGQSASASVTVTAAQLVSLAVTPVNPTHPLGIGAQFTATGTYTDGSTQDLTAQVTWTSSAAAVASISNAPSSHGRATTSGTGATSIGAALGGVSASTTFTVTPAQLVSIGVTPVNPSIPLGLSQALTATGVYTDGSTQNLTALATWSTVDPSIASVSNASGSEGRASALVQGSTVASASYGGLTGTTTLTVSPAALQQLQITPHTPSVPAGLTVQLTATGVFSDATTQDLTSSVSWGSLDASLVSVSNVTHGLATAIAAGSTTVTATQSGVTGSTTFVVTPAVLQSLQVTPANASRPRGVPQQFTATGLYSNGSTQDVTAQVTWSSTDPTVTSVSNATGSEGLGSTVNVGAVTIGATLGAISGSTPFTVTAAVLVSVAITPANSTVPLGSVRFLTATGTYTDGTTQNLSTQGSWTSSDVSVVSVSNATGSEGLASTLAIGSVTLTVTVSGFVVHTTMTVSQAALSSIELTPSNGSTALGYTRQFIAIGTYTDGTTQVLTTVSTWTSSDSTKAFISNGATSRGLMSTVAPGTITISATYGGVTGTTSHTISPAMLVSLAVSPTSATISTSGTRQLTATGSFSDGSTQDLTNSVTWSSNAPGVAQVSNASGSHGLATGISAGSATITATSGAQSATASLTVQ